MKRILLVIAVLYSSLWAQSTHMGPISPQSVNTIRSADQFPGADWCAKAVKADTDLGSTSGEIWLTQAAGTSVCSAALTLSSNHTLRFTSGGTFVLSCNGIFVNGKSNVNILGTAGAKITFPNSCVNFSRPIRIFSSTNVTVQGLEIDGNGNNQAAGEQDANIILNDSSQVKILNNYLHDAQGDGVDVNTDVSMSSGCEDVLIQGNTFNNLGRQFVSLTGYGCNDFRVLGNYFTTGTPVSTSSSTGNAVHIEGDDTGSTGFNKITIANNQITGALGTCISATSQSTVPIVGLVISNNQCTGTNSSVNLSAGIAALMTQDAVITGNTIKLSGATSGNDGILYEEAPSIAAQQFRAVIANNTIEGASSVGIDITSAATSGTPQSLSVHDNIVNSIAGVFGLRIVNNFSDIDIHDNILTNLQGGGIRLEAAGRFHLHHNTIRDFGLGGSSHGIDLTCNGSFTAIGPGEVETNRVGSSTTTSKTGISEACAGVTGVYVYNNDTVDNATPITTAAGYVNTLPSTAFVSTSPFTIGTTTIYEDSAGSVLSQRNSTTAQGFKIWGSYPSGSGLGLFGNYAGGVPGIQCFGTNCGLNLSVSPGTGSIIFRTAFNSGGAAMFLDSNAKLNLNGALVAATISTQLASVAGPTVTPTLGTSTTWTYKIVAKDVNGAVAIAGTGGSTALGAATLDSTHFNTITWSGVTGAASYDIYRTAVGASPTSTGKIGSVSTGSTLSLVDNGLAGDSATPPTANTTGLFSPGNISFLTTGAHVNGSAANNDYMGTIALAGGTSGAYTFARAWTVAPSCIVTANFDTTSSGIYWTTTSQTQVTINSKSAATGSYTYVCSGHDTF